FEGFLVLHRARWNARGETGVLGDKAIQEFHRDAAWSLLCRGMLRLYGLRIDGHLAAALYGFADHRRAYYYLSGFDPLYARMSPGFLIVGHAIQHAFTEGLREFDFLRGREPYKYDWGATDELSYRRILRTDCQYRGT